MRNCNIFLQSDYRRRNIWDIGKPINVLAHIVGNSENEVVDIQEEPLEIKEENCRNNPCYRNKDSS